MSNNKILTTEDEVTIRNIDHRGEKSMEVDQDGKVS